MYRLILRLLPALAAGMVLASCASTPPVEPGVHLRLVPGTELPPPVGAENGAATYRIAPFDKLSVVVFGVPDLSQTVQADSSGQISLPLVGAIDARGMTIEELTQTVEAGLRGRYVRNPQVTINLEETESLVVTVDGEVKQPGLYPVVGRLTLMRSVALARGTTEYANVEDVVVFRTVGDQEMAALYNLQAIRRGNYPDPQIYANDVVVVGDSPARRMFTQYLQAASVIVTPIITVLQRL